MALEPKYEEERDIRMGVVEHHLEAVVRRHLANKGIVVKVMEAERPDPRSAGPQPRGSVIVKEEGLLGKKLAEFYATGSWEIAKGHESLFEPVQEELRKRISLEVARANLQKISLLEVKGNVMERAALVAGGAPSYRKVLEAYLRATIDELEAQLNDVRGVELEALRARRSAAAHEAAELLPSPPEPWQRDLIPM